MRVSKDDLLCEIHTNGALNSDEIMERAAEAIGISSKPVAPPRLFLN
jgi:hypothetical protein